MWQPNAEEPGEVVRGMRESDVIAGENQTRRVSDQAWLVKSRGRTQRKKMKSGQPVVQTSE